MMQTLETVVFFGSGPVAAASLLLLVRHTTVEAVVTKPRPAGHTGSVPVIEAAEDLHLPVYFAENRHALDALHTAKPFQSRVGVLVDFGIIVSEAVIDYFPLGIVNSHFSLLPEWRGADPITFAILSGQRETGVSLMLLVAAMDEGPLLAQQPYPLSNAITTPELTNALIGVSDMLLADTLPKYMHGSVKPYPQDTNRQPTYSRRLTKADGIVDWHKPAYQLEREIRAYQDWPKSTTRLAGKDVVITMAKVCDRQGPAGTVVIERNRLILCCGEGALEVLRLKPAGKPEMGAEAFLAGNRQRL